MVASKKKRTDLEVPMWVIQEWSKGTKARDNMAEVLQRTNWDKDPLPIIHTEFECCDP